MELYPFTLTLLHVIIRAVFEFQPSETVKSRNKVILAKFGISVLSYIFKVFLSFNYTCTELLFKVSYYLFKCQT